MCDRSGEIVACVSYTDSLKEIRNTKLTGKGKFNPDTGTVYTDYTLVDTRPGLPTRFFLSSLLFYEIDDVTLIKS